MNYIKDLGAGAIWLSPVLKNRQEKADSYHGYGIQDYLQVNPRFGSNQELRELVTAAHDNGIYVILDIILNHVGNIFAYDTNRQPNYSDAEGRFDPRWDGNPYPVLGFNNAQGSPTLAFAKTNLAVPGPFPARDAACWPVEFQDPTFYTQKGRISNFDNYPEFLDGDFFDLKDVHHGEGDLDSYRASAALLALCEVYKYWVAFTDIDGRDRPQGGPIGVSCFTASLWASLLLGRHGVTGRRG